MVSALADTADTSAWGVERETWLIIDTVAKSKRTQNRKEKEAYPYRGVLKSKCLRMPIMEC
jgi:hypothetical protein